MQSMTTPDRTLDQILDLAAAHFKVPRQKLTPDDDFFKTLKIDSLQALDLLTRLEHHFNNVGQPHSIAAVKHGSMDTQADALMQIATFSGF